jgi:hypothetical protein
MRVLFVLSCLCVFTLAAVSETGKSSASRTTDTTQNLKDAATPASLVSEEQVNGWIKVWQRRLALDDWTIQAKVVRIWDLPQGAVANIHWSLPKKQATIKVMHSIDSNLKRTEIVKDTQLSVVHELVHLSMAKLPLDPNHTELEEEAVKKLSVALLELDQQQTAAPLVQAKSEANPAGN